MTNISTVLRTNESEILLPKIGTSIANIRLSEFGDSTIYMLVSFPVLTEFSLPLKLFSQTVILQKGLQS
jgi:hypothetical protein